MLGNALAHILAALVLKRYKPGLWIAVAGVIPAGVWALVSVQQQHPPVLFHVLGVGISIAIHLAILFPVLAGAKEATAQSRSDVQHSPAGKRNTYCSMELSLPTETSLSAMGESICPCAQRRDAST